MDSLNTRDQNETIQKRSYDNNILLIFQSNENGKFFKRDGGGEWRF